MIHTSLKSKATTLTPMAARVAYARCAAPHRPSPSAACSSSSPSRLFDKASAPSPRGALAPPATAPAPVPGNRLDAGASLAWLHSPDSSPVTNTAAAPLQASRLGTEAAARVARRAPPDSEGTQPYSARISFDNGVAEVSLEEADHSPPGKARASRAAVVQGLPPASAHAGTAPSPPAPRPASRHA